MPKNISKDKVQKLTDILRNNQLFHKKKYPPFGFFRLVNCQTATPFQDPISSFARFHPSATGWFISHIAHYDSINLVISHILANKLMAYPRSPVSPVDWFYLQIQHIFVLEMMATSKWWQPHHIWSMDVIYLYMSYIWYTLIYQHLKFIFDTCPPAVLLSSGKRAASLVLRGASQVWDESPWVQLF